MEYITANGTEYKCQKVTTAIDGIGFAVEGDVSTIASIFSKITSLTVAGEDKEVYGIYDNLKFSYAMVDDDGVVTVFMTIKSDTEQRIEKLETTQEEQDAAIASLIFGGEE